MVKRYYTMILLIILVIIGKEQSLYGVCTVNAQKKINEAFAHNALNNLFVEEIENVYNDNAIKNNTINYSHYYALNSFFECSHEMVQENSNALVHINVLDYMQACDKALRFIKKIIEYTERLKRGKVSFETADTWYVSLMKHRDALKRYRKLALLDLLVYTPQTASYPKLGNFGTFFKKHNYQQFFDDLNSQVLQENNVHNAEVAVQEFLKLNPEFHNKNTNEVALAVFNYLDEFKKHAEYYSDILSKEQDRQPSKFRKIFQRKKQGSAGEKIEEIKRYLHRAHTIQAALFETSLYERPPLEFAIRIEQANPAYRLILAETKALQRTYNQITSYFVGLLKELIYMGTHE